MKLFGSIFFFLLVLLALSIRAEEEFDEDVGDLADEGEAEIEGEDEAVALDDDEGEIDEEDELENVQVSIQNYFPESTVTAGKVSELLVSVRVSKDAVDEYTFGTIEGGFHYPQDWSYKVQNFSAIRYNRKLGAGEEATFMYPFMAAELAGGRSYGLQINLHYQADSSPPRYESAAVFNETVEVAENMDNAAAEQFFMFLTLAGFAAIGFAYFASKVNNKKKPAVVVETGTSGNPDSSWIPEQHLKKKVAGSPKTSPNARRRKAD